MVERIVKLAWTLLSLTGAIYALSNWREATLDHKAVSGLPDFIPDGPRDVAGRANIRRERVRFLTQAAFILPGVLSLVAPPPPPPPHRTRMISIACLMIGQIGAVANDVLDRADRKRVIEAPAPHVNGKRDD